MIDHVEDMIGIIRNFIYLIHNFSPLAAPQELRGILCANFGRICAGGVQEGTASAIDTANYCGVQIPDVKVMGGWVVNVITQKTEPTSANANDLIVTVQAVQQNGLNRDI